MARIPNRRVSGAQGAYVPPPEPTNKDEPLVVEQPMMELGDDAAGRVRVMTLEEAAEKWGDAAAVNMQTSIEVGQKVGLPARVRAMKHDTEYARDKEKTTFIVRVEDMMELFGWLGYPVEPPRVRGPER